MSIPLEDSRKTAAWSRGGILVLWITVALMLTYMHLMKIDLPNYDRQTGVHSQIVTHTAPSPYQYRILQPMLVEGLMRLPGVPDKAGYFAGYLSIRFLCLLVTLACMRSLAARYVTKEAALLGALLLAAVIPFTHYRYVYQPTSVLEWATFAAGFLLITRARYGALALLVLISTLNRETTIFLAAYYTLYHWGQRPLRRLAAEVALLAAGWALPFAALRLLWPTQSSVGDIAGYIRYNLTTVSVWVEAGLMIVPFLAVALFNWRSKPPALLRCLLVLPLWVGLHFIVAQANETRYYVPLLIPEIPLILLTIFPSAGADRARYASGNA